MMDKAIFNNILNQALQSTGIAGNITNKNKEALTNALFSSLKEQLDYEQQKAKDPDGVRDHNIGSSDYAKHNIQPWDIWKEYNLDPWRADIVKRVLRKKPGEERRDLEKIIHITQELIRQYDQEHPDDNKQETTNKD